MLYTEMTKKALRISFDAHRDQLDRAGLPYVYHPYHLAEQMGDETSRFLCPATRMDARTARWKRPRRGQPHGKPPGMP